MAIDFHSVVDPPPLEVVLSNRESRTTGFLAHGSQIRNRVRNACAEVSAGNEDPRGFAEGEIEVVDDLEHVVGNDDIEGSIRER